MMSSVLSSESEGLKRSEPFGRITMTDNVDFLNCISDYIIFETTATMPQTECLLSHVLVPTKKNEKLYPFCGVFSLTFSRSKLLNLADANEVPQVGHLQYQGSLPPRTKKNN